MTLTDLAQYAVGTSRESWIFAFPNGYRATVHPDPDPSTFFRFRVVVYNGGDWINQRDEIADGLSTAEVEAKLAAVYALPAEEN